MRRSRFDLLVVAASAAGAAVWMRLGPPVDLRGPTLALFAVAAVAAVAVYAARRDVRARFPGLPWLAAGFFFLALGLAVLERVHEVAAGILMVAALLLVWRGHWLNRRARERRSQAEAPGPA